MRTLLPHGHVHLALHELRSGEGPTLLLLHALADRTPDELPEDVTGWPGPIHGLDFTGHGHSTVPAGGGYTSEVLMGDADVALAHLGPCTVLGRGLGAFVALMIAGARPDLVRGAVLDDGAGLAGGGDEPGSVYIPAPLDTDGTAPDPWAVAELSRDLRPRDYATLYVRLALQGSDLREPLTVSARFRPSWLAAVAAEPGVPHRPVRDALANYAGP
ncbi:MAG TPA: alpha/beta hydrolase [Acidimicrobiales bacterium]|nr:alpha/beta hydrolase [Acidimicrobiales bacterium]